MSIIPGGSPSNLPMFRITCDGVALPATADLIALETMQSASGDATATLRFIAVAADRAWSTLPAHAPLGAWLEIALGYGTQVGPVFAGRVSAHRLSVAGAGLPERVLEAASTSTPVARRDDIALTAQYGATLLALEAARVLDEDTGMASLLQGTASLVGTTEATPGARMTLQGLGDGFSGDVCIVAVHHRLSGDGWTTCVEVRGEAGQG